VTGRVACVIPAYRAAHTLANVVRPLRETLPEARVIVVDDGSPDATALVAQDVADCVVRFPMNRGKGAALRAGFAQALGGDAQIVLTLDADGQHDPSYASSLIAALDGHDMVVGQRPRARSSMPLGRRLTNAMASAAIARVAGIRLSDTQSGFRAIRRVVLERVEAEGEGYEFETDFLIRAGRAGFKVRNAAIPTLYGADSHFRGVRDSVRIVKTIWSHRRPSPPGLRD
jgi:glycosyltransferase involved in cell wall biosynthesis